jgi:hypothetical protein
LKAWSPRMVTISPFCICWAFWIAACIAEPEEMPAKRPSFVMRTFAFCNS